MAAGRKRARHTGWVHDVQVIFGGEDPAGGNTGTWSDDRETYGPKPSRRIAKAVPGDGSMCVECDRPITTSQRARGTSMPRHVVCPGSAEANEIESDFAEFFGAETAALLNRLRTVAPERWHRALESIVLGRAREVADYLPVWAGEET